MNSEHEQRLANTEDVRFIPPYLDLSQLKFQIVQRVRDCLADGHRWLNDATREVCVHCGAAWGPAPPETPAGSRRVLD